MSRISSNVKIYKVFVINFLLSTLSIVLILSAPFLLIPFDSLINNNSYELKNFILITIFLLAFRVSIKSISLVFFQPELSRKRKNLLVLLVGIATLFIMLSLYILRSQSSIELFALLIIYSLLAPLYVRAINLDQKLFAIATWVIGNGALVLATLINFNFWLLDTGILVALACSCAALHLEVSRKIQNELDFSLRYELLATLVMFSTSLILLALPHLTLTTFIFIAIPLAALLQYGKVVKLTSKEKIFVNHRKLLVCTLLTIFSSTAIIIFLTNRA